MNMRRKHWCWLLILAILQGCGGPTESSARSKIGGEFDKWIAGEDSQARTFEASLGTYESPLSYSIRTVAPAKPKLPLELIGEYPGGVDADATAFRVIVDVVFRSQAGTPLTKVAEYNLTWIKQMNGWAISEKL